MNDPKVASIAKKIMTTKTTNTITNLETDWLAYILREWCSNPWLDDTWHDPGINLDPADYACTEIQCTRSNNEFHRRRSYSERKQKSRWLQRQWCLRHLKGMICICQTSFESHYVIIYIHWNSVQTGLLSNWPILKTYTSTYLLSIIMICQPSIAK